MPRVRKFNRADAFVAHQRGYTYAEIARKYHVSRAAVFYGVREYEKLVQALFKLWETDRPSRDRQFEEFNRLFPEKGKLNKGSRGR